MTQSTKKSKAKTVLMSSDDYILLFCAFRYALGRHTYVVGSIARRLIDNYNQLTEDQRSMFVKEIDEHYKQCPQEKGKFDWDYEEWIKVRDLYDPKHRVMVKAYWPIHKKKVDKNGVVTITSTINKKRKPKIERAVWSERKYWSPTMTSTFVFPKEIKGESWS